MLEDHTTDAAQTLPANLIGADLSGQDLSGIDLSGRDLSRANLTGARLIGARLVGSTLFEADLSGAECMGADFTGASLDNCTAHSAGFGRSNLTDASFISADLTEATFSAATLDGATLAGANFHRARMREASFKGAALKGASLVEADITDCNVSEARMLDVDLSGAIVRGVCGYKSATWLGAKIVGVDFCGAYLLRRHIMDENYLDEFRRQSKISSAIYWAWWVTSDCGRSLVRWGALTATIALVFTGLYGVVDIDAGDNATVLSPLYFSIVTLTTLGYGDVLPTSLTAQVVVMIQVVIGYFMLGGLLSIFANKMARRAT